MKISTIRRSREKGSAIHNQFSRDDVSVENDESRNPQNSIDVEYAEEALEDRRVGAWILSIFTLSLSFSKTPSPTFSGNTKKNLRYFGTVPKGKLKLQLNKSPAPTVPSFLSYSTIIQTTTLKMTHPIMKCLVNNHKTFVKKKEVCVKMTKKLVTCVEKL